MPNKKWLQDSRQIIPPGGAAVVEEVWNLLFDYSRESQKKKDKGPIPQGEYRFFPRERRGFPKATHVFSREAWGEFAWSLHIDRNEEAGREGFFIHGGDQPGSKGCIDIMHSDRQLKILLDNVKDDGRCPCYVPLKVSYSKLKALITFTRTHLVPSYSM